MKTPHCLHLPETHLVGDGFYQLLQIFPNMIQIVPAEDCVETDHPLISGGFVHQYAPLPFGEELGKFNRLVRDIQLHSSDFYGSTLSAMSAKNSLPHADEASVLGLIAQMKHPQQAGTDIERQETLLQARLLLKLIEIHERDEFELRKNLQKVNAKKAELFSLLRGEDALDGLQNDILLNAESAPPSRLHQRLKAWVSLLLAGENELPWCLSLSSSEIFALLQENLTQTTQPQHIISLPLAALPPNHEAIAHLTALHQERQETYKKLFHEIQKAAETGRLSEGFDADEIGKDILGGIHALATNEAGRLSFYLIPLPATELFHQGFQARLTGAAQASLPNTVISVLQTSAGS